MKKLVVENTYRSILLYILYDKNWKEAEFLIKEGRVSSYFIERLSEYTRVSTISFWPVFSLRRPITSMITRWFFLNKIKSYSEVIGNIFELHLKYSENQMQIDDGTMTLRLIKSTFKSKLKFLFLLDNFVIRTVFRQYYDFDPKRIKFLLPEYYKKEICGEHIYIDIKNKLSCLSSKELSEVEALFGIDFSLYSRHFENVIFLQPLFEEKLVASFSEEIELYKTIIKEQFPEGSDIYIKPHPRSKMNYGDALEQCKLIQSDFPYELLLCSGASFGKVVTITSSGVNELKGIAREVFIYGREHHGLRFGNGN